MRKYLLLTGAALVGLSGSAYAAIDCAVPPTCEELGYAYPSHWCENQAVLKCPFDQTKVFCGEPEDPYASVTCKVGSVLYNDLKCYNLAPSGKNAIGIVFDTTKRLAIALDEKSSLTWGVITPDSLDSDLLHLNNCNYYTAGDYQKCQSTGKSNTSAIKASVEYRGFDISKFAANICLTKTTGNLPTESWFMPSISELYTLYSVKDQINNSLSAVGGTPITSSTWSSDEFDYKYAIVIDRSGFTASLDKDRTSNVRCAIDY